MADATLPALDAEIETSRNQIASLQARVKALLEKRTQLKSQLAAAQLAAASASTVQESP